MTHIVDVHVHITRILILHSLAGIAGEIEIGRVLLIGEMMDTDRHQKDIAEMLKPIMDVPIGTHIVKINVHNPGERHPRETDGQQLVPRGSAIGIRPTAQETWILIQTLTLWVIYLYG